MVEKMVHRVILVVSTKNLNNLNNHAIQMEIFIPHHVFPSCKANTAPIRTVTLDCVARKFMLHEGAQTRQSPTPMSNLITTKEFLHPMLFAAASITVR